MTEFAIPNFAFGYALSLAGGGIAAPFVLWALRRYQQMPEKPRRSETEPRRIPAWITGLLERIFFTTVVAFDISGAAIAMIAWLTLKLAANWNRPAAASSEIWAAGAFSALLAGLVSMLFAALGGLGCRGLLW